MSTHGPIVLAAGGTGGHVFPAEALAAALLDRGARLALITDRRGGTYGGALGAMETHRIHAGAIAGTGFAGRLRSGAELALGTVEARRLLRRLRPVAVVGFGGYASLPTMFAATMLGLPTMIHEQNAVSGRANRLLAGRVRRIAPAFDRVAGLPAGAEARRTTVGMPVRPAILAARERPYPDLKASEPLRLLVLGGSQGARVFSDVIPAAVGLLEADQRRRFSIAQQCRPEDLDRVKDAYAALDATVDLAPFFDDVADRLAHSHVVIARAGASTVAELTALGRPALFVPYPFAADDHQAANAAQVVEADGGWMLFQSGFTAESLAEHLKSWLAAPAALSTAAAAARAVGRPDAADRLADLVDELIGANGGSGRSGTGAIGDAARRHAA